MGRRHDPPLTAITPTQPVDVDTLRGRVDQTWRLWHTSRNNRTEIGALLSDPIRDAESYAPTLDGDDRRSAPAAWRTYA